MCWETLIKPPSSAWRAAWESMCCTWPVSTVVAKIGKSFRFYFRNIRYIILNDLFL